MTNDTQKQERVEESKAAAEKQELRRLQVRDISAEACGLVTCRNVSVGALVSRGSDWCRKNEDCDAGVVVGYLLADGTEVGELPEINLRPYRRKDMAKQLCLVKWATGLTMVSSIGYNNLYEITLISGGKSLLGSTDPTVPCHSWCNCHCDWLSSRNQFFETMQSLGFREHGSEEWFLNKTTGKTSQRPKVRGRAQVNELVMFSDCFKYSLTSFRMPGSLWIENKVTLARLAGDLMSKTYLIHRDDQGEAVLERTLCNLLDPLAHTAQIDKTASSCNVAGGGDTTAADADAEYPFRLWFLKDAHANFGKNITLVDSLLDGLVAGGFSQEKAERLLAADKVLEQEHEVGSTEVVAAESEFGTSKPMSLVGFFNRDTKKNDGEFALQAHIPRPLLYEGTRKVRL
jgi:hypothetical protein